MLDVPMLEIGEPDSFALVGCARIRMTGPQRQA